MSPRFVWSRSSFSALAMISPTMSPSGIVVSSSISAEASLWTFVRSARLTTCGGSIVSCDCSMLATSRSAPSMLSVSIRPKPSGKFANPALISHETRGVKRTPARVALRPAIQLTHDLVGLLVGFGDPFDDAAGLRRVFQLDADGAVEPCVADGGEVALDRRHAAAGREVAVRLAVAVGQVHVRDPSLQ